MTHLPAPQAGDVTKCWRCEGNGCPHCGHTGYLYWLGYGLSRPAVLAQTEMSDPANSTDQLQQEHDPDDRHDHNGDHPDRLR